MIDPDRIACCVPFCRRTAARAKMPGVSELICGKCGRRAPRELANWRAIAKHQRKAGELTDRHWRRYDRAWERFKAAAIARAGEAPPAPRRRAKTTRLSPLRRPMSAPGSRHDEHPGDE